MNNKKLGLSDINNLVQIIAIIAAGIWAFYTFVYLQIYIPSKNLRVFQIELTLEEVGSKAKSTSKEDVVAILAKIKGTNTSKKSLSIVSGYLEIWADKILNSRIGKKEFESNIPKAIETYNGMTATYYAKRKEELIFVGAIFSKYSFEPGESLTTYRMIYMPKRLFDHIEANAWVLSGAYESDILIKHIVKDGFIDYSFIAKENDKQVEYSSANDTKLNELLRKKDIGKSTANFYLSLWNK
jgi:hypothetical protein